MKQLLIAVGALLSLVTIGFLATTTSPYEVQAASEEARIVYFHGVGCPHCAVVDEWLDTEDIWDEYPIDDREVYNNPLNAVYYNEVMGELGVPLSERGVPSMVIGNDLLIGDQPIIANFEVIADEYLLALEAEKEVEPVAEAVNSEEELSFWVIVGASLVDAINPCAFAVLIILLSTIVMKKDKKIALLSGLSFSAAIFISYVLMGLGLYSAINAVGVADKITTVVGILAIILGLLNIKDFFWYGKGTLIEVPRSWRPKMRGIISRATSPLGAFFIAFLVSLFLLPCTSGPYVVVLGLLAQNPLDAQAIFYLVLYNLIFVSPMVIITISAYRGLDIDKLEYHRQANLERLHLIAGLILIALGVLVLWY